ncbi:MAG: hypothetical protein K5922_07550, partial [Clostridiales bacterium]|nr:hypothetical protein [Clostridiales bacterium]
MKAPKKKTGKRVLAWMGGILFAWAFLWVARGLFAGRGPNAEMPERVELSFEEAMADGALEGEEIAVHYAPEICAAVNRWLSDGGKGDFLAAVDFDGDLDAGNNWENTVSHPLS